MNPESGSQLVMSDEISKLPDSLLQHILSFLPTKEAIATSLVSKMWKPLWRSLSTLDLDDSIFGSSQHFVQFVDAVLMFGDFRTIKKFHLLCRSYSIPPKQIKIWAYAALKLKVEQLELIFPFCCYSLPSSVFVCSTIKELKLEGLMVDPLSRVNLPSLKIMHLQGVQFHGFKCVAMLLSGCPLLESLSLSLVGMDMHASVLAAVGIASLKHLSSAAFPPFMMTLKAFSNVKFLSLCQDVWSPSQDIPMYFNLTRLEFGCFAEDWGKIVKCLHSCPKLQDLFIHNVAVIPSVRDEENALMEQILDVPECISSHLKKFYLAGYNGSEYHFRIVRYIMEKAKVLRIISISITGNLSRQKKQQIRKRLFKCPTNSVNCRLLFN